MKVLLVNGSSVRNGNTNDREGLQTMRTLARNMGWLMQKICGFADRPEM